MVHMKQTAKKSTCETAPRISLHSSGIPISVPPGTIPPFNKSSLTPVLTSELQPAERQIANESATHPCLEALFLLGRSEESYNGNNNVSSTSESLPMLPAFLTASLLQFCYICMDGGDLWRCDLCIHSKCKKCIIIPPEYFMLVAHKDIKYLCLSYHLIDDIKTNKVMPYMVSTLSLHLDLQVGFILQAFYWDQNPVLPQPPRVLGHFQLSLKSFIQAPTTFVLHLQLKTMPAKGPITMLYDFL
ncbi:hypothetical protein J3R82DRAFT_11129 [Butyriboletus roseoflavus]|nr:hypothetical protein J3R82DRAFT_11129 [Butyriboletus roseoflavus]